MTLRLRDTLSGETRELEPLEPGHVRIYSCGPTVYGPTHIGNFRSFLFADVLVRYLRYRGLRVTWVMNVTDVDDRIIANANAVGESIGDLTGRWLGRFERDYAALRMTVPDVLPRATDHIPEMAAIMPTVRTTGRSSSGSARGRRTAAWPGWTPSSSRSASGSRRTTTARTTRGISPCGRARSRASLRGRQRSVRGGRGGTSNALR